MRGYKKRPGVNPVRQETSRLWNRWFKVPRGRNLDEFSQMAKKDASVYLVGSMWVADAIEGDVWDGSQWYGVVFYTVPRFMRQAEERWTKAGVIFRDRKPAGVGALSLDRIQELPREAWTERPR